jgi:ribosomal protein S18 acetylase RimI-like enzyme
VPQNRAPVGPSSIEDQAVIELSLRRARASDAAAVAAIHVAARRKAMPYLPEPPTDDEVCAWVAGGMLQNAVVWVAEIDGGVAGYVASRGTDLDHLYVAPECQGRGVGSLLLSKAKELSPEGLELYAFRRNSRARAFYETRGFDAIAFSDGAGNEEQEPDVLYRWTSGA